MAYGIESDVQKLEPGAVVELFELDTRELGGVQYFFHSGTSVLKTPVKWQGNDYNPFPIEAEGFEMTSKGTLPMPTMRVANVTGLVGAMCNGMDDLLGAIVIRRRTFAKYLDAANFPGGVNPTADPNAHFPDEIWRVNRKVNENKLMVEFELASSLDMQGVMLPRRQVIANTCAWKYKSPECGYTGTLYFTTLDEPTTLSNDRCGKRLNSCRLRFGRYAVLPYGGFPAAGRVR